MKLVIYPNMVNRLNIVGENIKLARLRRKLSIEQISERSSVSIDKIKLIENGDSEIMLGEYLLVLRTLNLENDIYVIGENDILGRKLQDFDLLNNNE